MFYDISASPQGRSWIAPGLRAWRARWTSRFAWRAESARVAQAEEVLAAGAEKISVNSPALENPDLINALSERFGAQCVVVGVDSQTFGADYRVQQFTGDIKRSRDTSRSTLDWVVEAQQRGAGEIVLNCMSSDGVRGGFDIAQLRAVRGICQVPLVASGGAGAAQHFARSISSGERRRGARRQRVSLRRDCDSRT